MTAMENIEKQPLYYYGSVAAAVVLLTFGCFDIEQRQSSGGVSLSHAWLPIAGMLLLQGFAVYRLMGRLKELSYSTVWTAPTVLCWIVFDLLMFVGSKKAAIYPILGYLGAQLPLLWDRSVKQRS